MPSRRTFIAIVAMSVVALAGMGVAVFFLTNDDITPPTGDVIAYNCIEQNNPWFAICVTKSDGTDKRRLTHRLKTTAPAWSPDARRIAFTRNEDVGEYTTFSDDDVFAMGRRRQRTTTYA